MTLADPVYKAVAESLRTAILAGEYPPTRRLPTDAELAESFNVSRQTVRQAFNQLVLEGLVYRVRGRGSFAVGAPAGAPHYLRSVGSIEDLLAFSLDTELEVVQVLTPAMDVAIAARLHLPTDEVVAGVFRRLHRERVFAVTRFYFPPSIGMALAKDRRIVGVGMRTPATIAQLIEERCGTSVAGAHQSITATMLDAATAELIDGEAGEPGLSIDRVYYDAAGRFIQLALSTFNVTRYSYRLDLRRSML